MDFTKLNDKMKAERLRVKEYEFEERVEPEFFQFKAEGETICGVLENVESISVDSKPVTRYTVYEPDEDKRYTFLGTYQINSKLRRSDIGRVIEVTLTGKDSNVRGGNNGNPMSLFRVRVAKAIPTSASHANANGLGITDADVPF